MLVTGRIRLGRGCLRSRVGAVGGWRGGGVCVSKGELLGLGTGVFGAWAGLVTG